MLTLLYFTNTNITENEMWYFKVKALFVNFVNNIEYHSFDQWMTLTRVFSHYSTFNQNLKTRIHLKGFKIKVFQLPPKVVIFSNVPSTTSHYVFNCQIFISSLAIINHIFRLIIFSSFYFPPDSKRRRQDYDREKIQFLTFSGISLLDPLSPKRCIYKMF